MEKLNLEVKARDLGEPGTKITLTQMRNSGYIPAVIYGHGDPVQVAVDAKAFQKAIHTPAGTNALFTVTFGGKKDLTVIKDVQRDIITRHPIHVDFQRIDLKEKLEITIPVHLEGEAPGVKVSHGILQHIQRDLRIKCLPDDLPASLSVDISKLEIHHSIKVEDLTPPAGVEILTQKDHIVVGVVAPKVEEEAPKPAATVEGAGAQPEVIAKGKKEEEGAAPVAGAAAPAKAASPAKAAAPAADQGDKKKAK